MASVFFAPHSFRQGHDVVRALEAGRPGPWMSKALASVVEWQLAHPDGTKEQCEQWLRDERAAGRINLDVTSNARPAQSKRRNEGGATAGKKPKT